MKAIFKRELRAYFTSPLGYVFIGVLLLFAGLSFGVYSLMGGLTSLNATLQDLQIIFFLLVPILTMRMFAEERKNKVDQLLLTAPVRVTGIVIGKYLAAVSTFLLTLLVVFSYTFIIRIYSPVAFLETIFYFIGFFLFGAALISVGMWISTLTESQVISAIISYAVIFLLMSLSSFANLIPNQQILLVVQYLAPTAHFNTFSQGLLGISDIVYYVTFTIFFIYLTVRMIEKRRWS